MSRLSIALAAFATVLTAGSGFAQPSANPADRIAPMRKIVIFGASWCAPCIAELRNITALAAAASPSRIIIAWTDGRLNRYQFAPPANVDIASGPEIQRMVRQYASEISGLPYSVMLNQEDRKCAEWRSMLSTEAIKQMHLSCE